MELSLTLPPPLANRSERSLLHQGVNPSPRLVAPPRSQSVRYPTRPRMDMLSNVARASLVDDNGSPTTPSVSVSDRFGEVKRMTKETNVSVRLNLDGLVLLTSQLASHGLIDVHARATGDVHIDDHPTNEDVALAIGTQLVIENGINRFGDFSAPLDEALIHVALKTLEGIHFEHLSGRPYLVYDLQIPTQRVGTYDTQLSGRNSHHIIEATFKAFARALRQVTEADLRRHGTIPSSKGVLSRS